MNESSHHHCWEKLKLSTFAEEVRDLYEPTTKESLTYIGLEHIEQQTLRLLGTGISSETQSTKKMFKKGDILFGSLRPYFKKVVRPKFSGVCSTDITIVRAKSKANQGFLHYFISSDSFISFATNSSNGTRMPRANWKVLSQSEWEIPPLPTQHKIASILSAYDDLIENNTQRIRILEEMAQALYREWFVNFRFPGHEKVRMVESELGMIPEGWEVKRLGDVVSLHRGKSYRTSDLVDEGGIPFLNLKCIERGGGFRYDGVKRFQGEYKPTQTAKTGDIIVAVTDMTQERRLVAHAARVHIIGNDFAVMSMDLVKIEPNKEVSKDYLHGVLRFSDFSQEVRQHANGVNVLHLNPSQIQEFKFALPTTELRNLYAELCASAYQECDVLHAKNANLRRTRDLLLPKLISGEVDVEKIDVRLPNV